MGMVWEPDRSERTALGELLGRAKDHGSPDATASLAAAFGAWVSSLDFDDDVVVTTVPASRARPNRLVGALGVAAAAALGVPHERVVTRRGGPPVRDTPLAQRAAILRQACFAVTADVADRHVVVVDDVVLSGSTLRHVGGLLHQVGASRVCYLVAARSRLNGELAK